jgi:hypothetical protein
MAKLKNCKKPGPPGEPHYIAEIPQKYIDMFYDKVEHQPNGCEFFTSKTQNTGYCNWYYYRESDNKIRYITAHKFAAFISGKFTEHQLNNYCVLHSCDENYATDDISYRRCVNPDHMWIGTPRDNVLDCMKKGRYKTPPIQIGEDNYNSTLTQKQAEFIIDNHYKISQKRLSEICDCSISAVQLIHMNKTWRHLAR